MLVKGGLTMAEAGLVRGESSQCEKEGKGVGLEKGGEIGKLVVYEKDNELLRH